MRPPEGSKIRAILDHSAMLSYAGGHIHVGEVMREIADDRESHVGLPVVALLQAHLEAAADKESRLLLRHLTALPYVSVLLIDELKVINIADVAALTGGDLARAHAAWVTLELDALCLTAEPERIPSIIQSEAIIAIPVEDA